MGQENSKMKIVPDYPDTPLRFNELLLKCIRENNLDKLKTFLESINNPQDARDCRGASLLHSAAEYGNVEMTKYLIDMGFVVDLQDEYGRTALMIALKKQHVSTAKVLLESHADIWLCDTLATSALQILITMDPIESLYNIPCLLWTYPYWQCMTMMFDKVDARYSSNAEKIADFLLKIHCPMTHVVFMKNCKVLKIMIHKGSSIDARDRFTGMTALHLSVCYWKLDKVKILLSHGADVNILNYHRKTPLMCIYHMIHFLGKMPTCEVELVEILLKNKPKMFGDGDYNSVRQMEDIFTFGSKDAVRIALESDADLLMARYVTNHSLLHIIAMNENPGIEEVIRGRKMDVDDKDYYGDTALIAALKNGKIKLVECLLDEGASIDIKNRIGVTPMHVPFDIQEFDRKSIPIEVRLECVKVMLEHGGDPEITFENGDTILKVVLQNKNFALAEPVLAQLAMYKVLGLAITEVISGQIESHEEFRRYFHSCTNEFEDAKSTMISRFISLFDFLTASDEVISLYARNRGLMSKLSSMIGQLKLNSYYTRIFQKRFSIVSNVAALRKKVAAIILQNIGELFEFNSVITDVIIEYLDDEDVKKLLS